MSAARVERFRQLYDATYPRIMAYTLRRAASREDALDAVSETFMIVWRRLEDVPPDPRRVPWVYGVARRVLANQFRSRARRARLKERLESEGRVGGGEPDFDLVHQALSQLRPVDRELLTLSAWDDLDNEEIAEVMALSPQNVAVRLHRARSRLARSLARLGMRGFPQQPVKSEDVDRTPNGVNGTVSESGGTETP